MKIPIKSNTAALILLILLFTEAAGCRKAEPIKPGKVLVFSQRILLTIRNGQFTRID